MPTSEHSDFCQRQVERMLRNSQTKVIMPVITLALVRAATDHGKSNFTDAEIRAAYNSSVAELIEYLRHDLHIGAKYYDAYGSRMTRYEVLKSTGHLTYELDARFHGCAQDLVSWIPERIKNHIDCKLGEVPGLGTAAARLRLAESIHEFECLIREQIDRNPTNFEIFTFAVIKVHLEKFACKVYRDTRTSAHDRGVDLSTNFGVVYQIKKLRLASQSDARSVISEIQGNFDQQRVDDGNVVLVIDEVSREVKQYLIDMKIQSLSKSDLMQLVANFSEVEDRQKVLRIVFEEFRREYSASASKP